MDAFTVAGALVVAKMARGMITARPSTAGNVIVIVTGIALAFTLGAGRIEKALGESGLSIVSRIFGRLLLSIAIASILESLL